MKTHPFKPQISKVTKKLLVGTLPPEEVEFYFSNSSNTRLWDILKAINNKAKVVGKGGNLLSGSEKIQILDDLQIGIGDIIYRYIRDEYHSTKDKHIEPIEYADLLQLAVDNGISDLLFVYQSALKWFNHSLEKGKPIRLQKLKTKYNIGFQKEMSFQGKTIKCILLPSPLNRGKKGQTLDFKLELYCKYILGK